MCACAWAGAGDWFVRCEYPGGVGAFSQRGVPELSVVGTEQSFSIVAMDKFGNRVREVKYTARSDGASRERMASPCEASIGRSFV